MYAIRSYYVTRHTGQPLDKVRLDTDRDNFMSGEDAVAYGLIDAVLSKRGETAKS